MFQILLFLIYYGGALLSLSLFVLFVIQKVISKPFPIIIRHKEETFFIDPETVQKIDFPSIVEEPSVELSVIVPAYDEEKRLPKMLDECLDYLNKKIISSPSFTYEVIIISDGSNDRTVSVGLRYSEKHTMQKVRVMELIENRGKGGAVRLGMLSARGKYLLLADADGATQFSDLNKLNEVMENITTDWKDDAIVIGSRAHLEENAIAERSFFRTILMHGFHTLVWLFGVRNIRDTQCGFKLFTRSTATKLFYMMHVERWAFDVELLYIAQKLKIRIEEVAVNWTEIDGSKITPIWSWLQMGIDLFLIWFRYTCGTWKIDKKLL